MRIEFPLLYYHTNYNQGQPNNEPPADFQRWGCCKSVCFYIIINLNKTQGQAVQTHHKLSRSRARVCLKTINHYGILNLKKLPADQLKMNFKEVAYAKETVL